MPRAPRMLVQDQSTVYHVISRTCLPGFPLDAPEKEYLLSLFERFSRQYFVDVLGFCIMGNHFHLLLRMQCQAEVSDGHVLRRYRAFFHTETAPHPKRLAAFRAKWTSLSELMRDIKQTFSRYYNKKHNRSGYFWGDRFKSVIIQDGAALLNCLAYIDLNPIRAGIARRPEDYRWCSLGYHLQSANQDGLLSVDYGLGEDGAKSREEQLQQYREFVYRTGALDMGKGAISARELERAEATDFIYTNVDRLILRTRWFTCGAILGSQSFVSHIASTLGLRSASSRSPHTVNGLEGICSFRRLREI